MEVDHPSGIRQCDSVAFLLAIVAPSSWTAPGNKLPFGTLEQHCLSPGGHLRVSSTPLGGVEASPPAAVEAFDFPVGTLSCPELGLAVSHCSWAEGSGSHRVLHCISLVAPKVGTFSSLCGIWMSSDGEPSMGPCTQLQETVARGHHGHALHPPSCGFTKPHWKCPGPDMLTGLSHADTCNLL